MSRGSDTQVIALQNISAGQDDRASTASLQPHPVTRHNQILVLISEFLTICFVVGFNQPHGLFQQYYTSSSRTILPTLWCAASLGLAQSHLGMAHHTAAFNHFPKNIFETLKIFKFPFLYSNLTTIVHRSKLLVSCD